MKTLLKKIKSNNGESLTETLVALAIGALALVLLVSMVQTASKLITSSKTTYDNYISQLNVLSEKGSTDKIGTLTVSGTNYYVYYYVYSVGDTDIISYKEK